MGGSAGLGHWLKVTQEAAEPGSRQGLRAELLCVQGGLRGKQERLGLLPELWACPYHPALSTLCLLKEVKDY